jgi:hypothetical protein
MMTQKGQNICQEPGYGRDRLKTPGTISKKELPWQREGL